MFDLTIVGLENVPLNGPAIIAETVGFIIHLPHS